MEERAMTTVIIVEDHAVVAEGISNILVRAGMEVIDTCRSWDVAASRYSVLRPDVVLLDLNVPPDGNGLKLIPLLRKANPAVVIVCVSAASSAAEVNAALEAGATGFISKGADPEEFPPLIELALAGETAVDKRTASKLITASRKQSASVRTATLTERELKVLELIAQGRSNYEIAETMMVSRTSVSNRPPALRSSSGSFAANPRCSSSSRSATKHGLCQ
jgi:DNA-binding NarL/FixJ family response regulator